MPSIPRPRLRKAQRAGVDARAERASSEPNVEVVEHGGLRWINIERPGPVDRAWLEEHFEFHPLDYEDVLSRNQRPKIDEYEDYLFIVLYYPVFDKTVGRLNAVSTRRTSFTRWESTDSFVSSSASTTSLKFSSMSQMRSEASTMSSK